MSCKFGLAALLLLTLLSGCAGNPATGGTSVVVDGQAFHRVREGDTITV